MFFISHFCHAFCAASCAARRTLNMPVRKRHLVVAPQPKALPRVVTFPKPPAPVVVSIWKADQSQRLLNVKEAATYFGLKSPWHIRQMFKNGTLKPIRLGRRDMVDRAGLDAFIDSLKQGAA
jgi:hypothetical protein